MATKYGVKLVYRMNGNQQVADAMRATASDSPLYRPNLSAWATQYENYLNEHRWDGNNSIKIKKEADAEDDTLTITYLIEDATAENAQYLQNMHLWSQSNLQEIFEWRLAYYSHANIELVSKEVIAI